LRFNVNNQQHLPRQIFLCHMPASKCKKKVKITHLMDGIHLFKQKRVSRFAS
jgi:hypothetical protein